MSNIATPAYRLTANCIWNSFRSSGKRHILLTGSRGSGKTTLLSQLFSPDVPGITTWAEPQKAVYLRERTSGKISQIGVYDAALPGPENKMALCRQGFEALGVPALYRCIAQEQEWMAIDEIGYLECGCPEYLNALEEALQKKHVAAAIRKQDLPFLHRLRSREDVFLIDLDAPFGPIGCVIMASGLGKRFGGNKLMADFQGRPLIRRMLDATEGIFAQRVVVTRHEEIHQLCRAQGVPSVLHHFPLRSDTVRLGLEAMPGLQRCMFCPGDQPMLRQDTVAALALSSLQAPDRIWRPICQNIPGAPVIFPSQVFPELKNLPEGKGGGFLIQKYPHLLRTLPIEDPNELKDVDSPEDLQALLP